MTRTFPSHDAIFLSIPRRIIGKLKDCCGFRCIPIIGAICLVVQIILLTTQRDKQCVGCPTNNNSYLTRIWNFFSRGYEPLLPLCPRTPPDLRKYAILSMMFNNKSLKTTLCTCNFESKSKHV